MHHRVRDVLDGHGGIARREELLRYVSEDALEYACSTEALLRLFPETFVDPALAGDRRAVIRAALTYAGGRAALSHTTALDVWGIPVPVGTDLHLTVDERCRLRGAPGLRLHRRAGFTCEPPDIVVRDGLPVTRLERSIVDTWPILDGDARRAPAITAVSRRLTTPGRLAEALTHAPRLAGRALLADLVALLRAGCRSPLEIWGYRRVFTGPEFARLRWQEPVRLDGRTVYLDALDPATLVNFELDGAKYHAGTRDRERDLRRDAALQARGYTVVRFSHDWLTGDPAGVRARALEIVERR